MNNKLNFKTILRIVGIISMVLVFGITVLGCEDLFPEEEKYGAETINGVWYRRDGFGEGEKTGTVIEIKDGVGILKSVGDEQYDDTKNYVDTYANYVSRGLINIGDVVFRNIVYTGVKKLNDEEYEYTWSYDIWFKDGNELSYMHDDGGDPDWRYNQELTFYNKSKYKPYDRLLASYYITNGNQTVIGFRKD